MSMTGHSRGHIWAQTVREWLLLKFGRKCKVCKTTGTEKNGLEFDCIIPQGDDHHRAGFISRQSFYRKQAKLGNLQLLCQKCHIKKTKKELENEFHLL